MCFDVSIRLPPDVEARLRAELPDLSSRAQHAVLIDLFRRGRLSHHELALTLGLDRFETDAWLKRHSVYEGGLRSEDVDHDLAELKRALGRDQ